MAGEGRGVRMGSIEQFRSTLSQMLPPPGAAPALQALWWAAKGEWERAHVVVTTHQGDPTCDLVHAHLHRQQGDEESARSWYADSGEAACDLPIEQEWRQLAQRLLPGRDAEPQRPGG